MIRETVRDRSGNLIYLTDERWNHIIEFHPEMLNYKKYLFTTLRKGKRKQEPLDPSIYTYYCKFRELEKGYNHVIVVVKFGYTLSNEPNNFVLTAFQKYF